MTTPNNTVAVPAVADDMPEMQKKRKKPAIAWVTEVTAQ